MSLLVQRSLAGGELTESLRRRVDLDKFQNSLALLRNGFVKKAGGIDNRAGTEYVFGQGISGPAIASSSVLVPWVSPSGSDSYVLEFGNQFIRFFKDGAVVTVSGVTAWSNATAYVIGDLASRLGVNYYCIAAHTNQQPPNATYWHALSGDEYSIPTPYTTTLLQERGSFDYVQDSDRMLITHGSVTPRELTRTANTTWKLTSWNVDGSSPTRYGLPGVNAPGSFAHSGGTGSNQGWAVAAVTTDLEESLPSYVTGAGATSGSPVTLTWNASTFNTGFSGTVKGYNIYKNFYDSYYFIAFVTGTSFVDSDLVDPAADSDSPFETRTELNTTAGTLPKKCGAFHSRILLGNFSFNVQAGYASRIGYRQNFTRRYPSSADDSILFQTKGKQISGIRWFMDIGELLIMTDSGHFLLESGSSGTIEPGKNPKQRTRNAASGSVRPIGVDDEAVYVQERGRFIRSAQVISLPNGQTGIKDIDLTVFAEHLFRGYTITELSFIEAPHPTIVARRSDGILLGCTYLKEQQILAWYRFYETDGDIEKMCVIPEGTRHSLYMVVKRNINGSDVRYLERAYDREFTDIESDAIFLDCAATYDGRNAGATTMTLSGGTNWDETEDLTLTASASTFVVGDVGDEIWLNGTDGIRYRASIVGYTGATAVTVNMDKTVPTGVGIRSTATTDWEFARDTVSGLAHLNGESVAVFANGFVVYNPNNEDYGGVTVSAGAITLPECYSVVHVGIPYFSDLETLNIDTLNGESMMDKSVLTQGIALDVQDTRGLFIGPGEPGEDDPREDLYEVKLGGDEDEDIDVPVPLFTGVVDQSIAGEWNSSGKVFIRQLDPLPFTLNSIAPKGIYPFKGVS